MTYIRRPRPRMGDALVVNWIGREIAPGTYAVVADCECGQAVYTAVSGSEVAARRLIYRKHVKHLATCSKQAELFALDRADDRKTDAAIRRALTSEGRDWT